MINASAATRWVPFYHWGDSLLWPEEQLQLRPQLPALGWYWLAYIIYIRSDKFMRCVSMSMRPRYCDCDCDCDCDYRRWKRQSSLPVRDCSWFPKLPARQLLGSLAPLACVSGWPECLHANLHSHLLCGKLCCCPNRWLLALANEDAKMHAKKLG